MCGPLLASELKVELLASTRFWVSQICSASLCVKTYLELKEAQAAKTSLKLRLTQKRTTIEPLKRQRTAGSNIGHGHAQTTKSGLSSSFREAPVSTVEVEWT